MTEREGVKRRAARLTENGRAAACGFLLGRGLSGGAVAVGWSMAALLGGWVGRLYGAALFAAGCAVVCVVRRGFGKVANGLLSVAVTALFALWQRMLCDRPLGCALVSGCLAVGAAVLLISGRGAGTLPAVLTVFSVTVMMLIPVQEGEAALRMTALCSSLSSAGLTGAALACVSDREMPLSWLWLAVGAAVGVV